MRFGPGAAGAALGLAARELRDSTVALEDVWGAPAIELAERLSAAPRAERLAVLAAAVARRLDAAREPDALVARASALLGAGMPVTAASREVALTDRHLRRRFHDAVGYGPKTLQRVLRLRRFLALAEAGPATDLARAAAEAGYSDQSASHARVQRPGGPAAGGAPRGARRRRRPGPARSRRAPGPEARPGALRPRVEERRGQTRQQLLGDAQRLAHLDVLNVVVLLAGGRGRRERGQAGAALEERALDVPSDDALGGDDGAPPDERAAPGHQAPAHHGVAEAAVAVGGEQRATGSSARAATGSHHGPLIAQWTMASAATSSAHPARARV